MANVTISIYKRFTGQCDISNSIHLLSWFLHTPKIDHMQAAISKMPKRYLWRSHNFSRAGFLIVIGIL